MKIRKGYYDKNTFSSAGTESDPRWTQLYNMWLKAAYECSLKYGTLVEVVIESDGKDVRRHSTIYPEDITRIAFQVGDQRYDSLSMLEKVLANKAFM